MQIGMEGNLELQYFVSGFRANSILAVLIVEQNLPRFEVASHSRCLFSMLKTHLQFVSEIHFLVSNDANSSSELKEDELQRPSHQFPHGH